MKTTYEIIQSYLLSLNLGYLDVRLIDYTINGTIIKISYSYKYDFSEGRSYDSDNFIEVCIIDYLTFILNSR